jgi:G8 domain
VVSDPSNLPTVPTSLFSIPNGPFVEPNYSERVVIPQPPKPTTDFSTVSQTDCPHSQAGLSNWNTLGLTPSVAWGDVILPPNTNVLIDSTVGVKLGVVTIPATSQLVISDANVNLDMKGMIVKGRLTVGSETCRIQNKVSLTFWGERPSDVVTNIPSPETKGISVDGGTLNLHGKRYYRTWTRLSKTASIGDRVLVLQQEVNWRAGQDIVLVTTAMKDSREFHQNEVHTVEYVFPKDRLPAGIGSAIQLRSPVKYQHVAIQNYQAEVGLLSRNIVIQGSSTDSEPTDKDPLNCSLEWNYGDTKRPCMDQTELTGYGAHIMIHRGGKGYLEGVELLRVGQTNVLGRYPVHFHMLGNLCKGCYVKHSAVRRSYYRCVSIHGTHSTIVSENVAFDVSGYCYYLEDGIETRNTISFNLAAFIHMIGPEPPTGFGQTTKIYKQSSTLTLPADVTASGFYITNVDNNIIGNTASGGWAGYAFPNLDSPVGLSRNVNMRPSSGLGNTIDGNTAHSTGWWWYHGAGFYFGGALFFDESNVLTYNPGRQFLSSRSPCSRNLCAEGNCGDYCLVPDQRWLRISNSKTYLIAGVGLNVWSGRTEIVGFESHDNGLAIEGLEPGIWIDNLLAVCRSGTPVALPRDARMNFVNGNGFVWYDTDQEHILTDSTFRRCGYRKGFDQYDRASDRGCGDEVDIGCTDSSSAFGFLTHSDEFNPGTYEICLLLRS